MKRRSIIRGLGVLPWSLLPLLSCASRNNAVPGQEWDAIPLKQSSSGERDAELLALARKRIEKIRKGNLRLVIKENGRALADSSFEIRHIRHEFRFGTTVISESDGEGKMDAETYKLYQAFNSITAKCYWNERWHFPIEKEEGKRMYEGFENEMSFGLKQGLEVKGHPLIWTVPKGLPEWLLKYPVEERLSKMLAHAGDLVNRYKGNVHTWDLCNEFLWEPSLNHTEQRVWPHLESIPEILTYLEPGIRHIRKQDPLARLVLNEYGLEKDFTKGVTAKQQRLRYLELIEEMRKRNCLPDAIGTQCHVAEPFSMEEIQTSLDELATSGLPLQITEFWARTSKDRNENIQADEKTLEYIRNAYTIGFGHPSVEHFTYWGGDLLEKTGKPGPKGKALLKLLTEEWTTQSALQTDKYGGTDCSAFFGEYALFKDKKEVGRFHFSQKKKEEVVEVNL